MAWHIIDNGVTLATGETFNDVIPAFLRVIAMPEDHRNQIRLDDHPRSGEPTGIMASMLLDRALNEEIWVREAYKRIVGRDPRPYIYCEMCKDKTGADRCPGTCEACKVEA